MARVYRVLLELADGTSRSVHGHGNTRKTARSQARRAYENEHGAGTVYNAKVTRPLTEPERQAMT